jgi:phenylacetate-CoA ligase
VKGIPLSLAARSELPGLVFPALVGSAAAPLHSIFLQLERSQWLSAQSIQELQGRQLDALLAHVWATVPWYHARLHAAGIVRGQPVDPCAWQSLQLLTRRDIQDAGASLHSNRVPPEHGGINRNRTSGSTGEPVEVLRSGIDQLMWQAITLRDHAWHERDLSGSLCSIRAGVERTPDETWHRGWGPATDTLFDTGPCALLPIDTDVAEQVRWLVQRNPDYLVIYPTVLDAVLRRLDADGIALPRLREVRTVGEVLADATRNLCRKVLGVPVVDLYSSNEVGNIALQCPESGLYHVQSESLLVEILDASDMPCHPGDIGRVVITTLHGFAMPLLRYELRDYAEVAAPCPCGRGLPSLRRIQGRVRNMLVTPHGEIRWPLVGFAEYRKVAPVRQYQIAQLTRDHVEFRLVTERPLAQDEEAALAVILRNSLGDFARIDFRYFPDLPLGVNGKFEEFISLIEPGS